MRKFAFIKNQLSIINYQYYTGKRKDRMRSLLIVLSCMLLVGCHARVRYPAETPSKAVISYEINYWLWGILGEKNYELYNECNEGRVFEIHVHSTMLQGVVTVMTFGIYTPRTVVITCSGRVARKATVPSQDDTSETQPEGMESPETDDGSLFEEPSSLPQEEIHEKPVQDPPKIFEMH